MNEQIKKHQSPSQNCPLRQLVCFCFIFYRTLLSSHSTSYIPFQFPVILLPMNSIAKTPCFSFVAQSSLPPHTIYRLLSPEPPFNVLWPLTINVPSLWMTFVRKKTNWCKVTHTEIRITCKFKVPKVWLHFKRS